MTEIDFCKREPIDAMRAAGGHVCSSHAFPSLYLWRSALGLEYWAADGAFSVRRSDDGSWLCPCGSEAGRLAFLAAHPAPGLTLRYVRAQDKAWLDAAQPGRWRFARTPNDDEYLYDRASHLRMAGGRYLSMRRLTHQLEREFGAHAVPLADANAADAARVLDAWEADAAARGVIDPVARTALRERKALGMQGVLIYLDQTPAALVMGFALSPQLFDVVVGKCAQKRQGLMYYGFNALAALLPEHVATLDLEEDLGLPGLHGMKERYLPDAKFEFWEARRQ